MKAVLVSVREEDLEERRRLGHDRFDEMWDGVLHMVPFPSWDHQTLADELREFLARLCRKLSLGVVRCHIGVHDPADPDHRYRGPDIAFVARGHESVIQERGIVGPADSVVEIRSPGDETYEKFPFYAKLGVREIVVIDRDTRQPAVHRLAGKEYISVAPDRDGWVAAEVLRVRLRLVPGRKAVRIESLDEPAESVEL